MWRHRGGSRVKWGFYWNLAKWEIVMIPKAGGVLPGSEGHRYLRMPILLLLALAPVMGGLYVVFLPFIGFAMALGFAGRKTAGALRKVFMELMTALSPAWRPGEAYFAGRRGQRGGVTGDHRAGDRGETKEPGVRPVSRCYSTPLPPRSPSPLRRAFPQKWHSPGTQRGENRAIT